jgi:hypothetical protein
LDLNGIIPVLVIGFMVVAIGFAIYSYYARKKAMKEFAARMGMVYTPHDSYGIQELVRPFPRFQGGHSHRSYDQVYGRFKGFDCCLFHYSYKTGSGKNESTHTFNGLLVTGPISLPFLLSVRPEGVFDTIMEAVGFDDIDFEYNEFNKKYYVKSGDKRMAYDFFGSHMMDFFLMLPRRINLEAVGPYFLLHYEGSLTPEHFERMMDTAVSLFNQIEPITREKYALSEAARTYHATGGARSGGFFMQ